MLTLLRKIFIKDYKNVQDNKVRERHGVLAAIIGIITNLLLFAFKFIIGILTMAMSVITDAINNLTDMASCIVSLIGFKLSNKPADKKHPFGHQRIEYIAGLIISFTIIVLAVITGYTSINKIINKDSTKIDSIAIFIILGAAILVKLWQSFFYRKMSKIINSLTLKANAQDSLNDCISTTLVLIATIITYFINDKFDYAYLIDPIVGILLSIFIIITGIKLLIETANPLIGVKPDQNLVNSVAKDILSYPGVLGIHDMVVHSYGPTTLFISIHVEVDSKVDVLKSHDLIDTIEQEIMEKYKVELTIHMDPVVVGSPIVDKIKTVINNYLLKCKDHVTFHDLRVVEGESHTNVIFDLVIPSQIKEKSEQIKNEIIKEIKQIDNKYNCVIKIDNSYVDY